jgi:hypothetical protein
VREMLPQAKLKFVLSALLVTLCVASGCGKGEMDVSAHRVGSTLIASKTAAPRSGKVSDAICTDGDVRRVSPRGAVQFVARCSGRGQVRNVVIMFARRVPSHPGRSVGVVAFRRYAKVVTVGPEHDIRRSRCRTRQGFVLCELAVRAKGHTTLFGRAWIRKRVICSAETSVVATESEGENIRSAQLFNGLPRGC